MPYDEHTADRIRTALSREVDVIERKMFGGLSFLVGGHLAVAASHRGGLLVRVDPADVARLEQRPGVGVADMGGRRMEGWLQVDDEAVADDTQLQEWVGRGVDFVATLPPRQH